MECCSAATAFDVLTQLRRSPRERCSFAQNVRGAAAVTALRLLRPTGTFYGTGSFVD